MNKAFEKILDGIESLKRNKGFGGTIQTMYADGMLDKAKQIVQEVAEEYNNGWIPCSERLPECGTKVLVQYGCGRINIEECKKNNDGIIGFYDGNYWSNADNYSAWQQLPEPYKERD